ncbi:hypothetical protein VNO77_25473 [Canavalia gladiata]|uniref:Uncharacterized protein n=1 Tax=Canavalia gladiata TaxID=3824 RepID=A0AAN9LDB9_CANGL
MHNEQIKTLLTKLCNMHMTSISSTSKFNHFDANSFLEFDLSHLVSPEICTILCNPTSSKVNMSDVLPLYKN